MYTNRGCSQGAMEATDGGPTDIHNIRTGSTTLQSNSLSTSNGHHQGGHENCFLHESYSYENVCFAHGC
ncbi:hypothetical protein A6D6_01143 [Alcanivorax xiamenensis]|uniref:Uncharacterized protein n=1 Tax=Alcanivorax xiamenensis TaxID=1177156 RepID=A0ABQ6YB42_9GAMM|nr:hypothetical protein A6D6_01143 [Alcanivorax xiamenensis]